MSDPAPRPSTPAPRGTTPHAPTPRQRAIARLAWLGVTVLGATQRVRLDDPHNAVTLAQSRPVIFATWHNRLALAMMIRGRFFSEDRPPRRMATLVSASRDGALLAAILESFGAQPVRGSSSRRGSRALLELHDLARRGYHIAITPDGPRGPKYCVQPGALALARLTGFPIIPAIPNSRWKLQLRSWDRFQIPLPGSACEVRFAAPLWVPETTQDLAPFQAELQRRLLELKRD